MILFGSISFGFFKLSFIISLAHLCWVLEFWNGFFFIAVIDTSNMILLVVVWASLVRWLWIHKAIYLFCRWVVLFLFLVNTMDEM
jgi:hypothetical protein